LGAHVNVLYLHQHFATRTGAGGTRSYEFALRLLAHGHTVTMVTANRKGGGIDRARRQRVDGIDIISLGGWYSNYLSPARRVLQFLRFTLRCSLLRRLPNRPDVVVATSTPLTIGIPGVLLARRFRVPLIFEVRDLWPQAPIELGVLRDPFTKWAARRLERWCYRKADHIIALSPGMAEGVLATGIDPAKVTVIPNASDTALFGPDKRDREALRPWGVENNFVAVHAGSMGAANGLTYVLEAARVLATRGEDDIRILIAGDGSSRPVLEQRTKELGIDSVIFTGSIEKMQLTRIVSSADAAIVCFANYPVLATNSPNKLFDALAAGLPCVVNSPGWTRDLVLEHDAGTYVDPTKPEQLADALVALRDDSALRKRQGAHARTLAEEQFDRDHLAEEFERVLTAEAAQ
jgi:glycosyltransferase involved in cell wall biosynthesis